MFRSFRRCASARWICALLLAATALPSAAADEADPAAAEPARESASAQPFYRVVIDAPSALRGPIERGVGLVRWQSYADMTDELLDRLSREAQDEVREAVATEGYFTAKLDISVDRSTKPWTVTLKITPGEPTRISDVRIDVTGPANTDVPRGTDAIAKLRDEWLLPRGDTFRQATWTAAKERAAATLRAAPFPAARIAQSRADIDPEARTGDLSLEIESGPAYRFGPMAITGLKKYQPSIVENYSSIKPGDPYGEAPVETFIRRLNSTGYFSSVQATIDVAAPDPENATLNVAVIEAPTRTFEGGLGYSTDVRYTAKLSYRDVNIDDAGLQMLIDGQLDGRIQSGSLRFVQPANASGWVGAYGAGAKRTDIEGLVTQTASFGTRWNTIEERRQHALSATYYVDDQTPEGQPTEHSRALYLEAEEYWRDVDVLIAPNKGWMASLQGGGGVPGVSTRNFGRVVGRFAAWYPVTPLVQLNFRADAGAVIAGARDGIPSTLLFRTGGDTTVRGYAFESLGVQQGGAVVGGRYYAVTSVEAIRWIAESWGVAAFVDAGNATDSIPDFRFALGYGIGARVRTPLGPFRLDLAYGQDVHEFRLHFSVGLSF